HRGHPLGDVIGPGPQVGDDFVELEVYGPEVFTGDVPVRLLALQRQVDQIHQRLLQMSGNSRGCRSHSILLTLRRGAALPLPLSLGRSWCSCLVESHDGGHTVLSCTRPGATMGSCSRSCA